MMEHTNIKQEGAEARGRRYGGGFKKKNRFKKHNNNNSYIDDVY